MTVLQHADVAVVAVPRPAVGLESLTRCLLRLLPLFVSWFVVVVLGRCVCHVARRLPPMVWLVRAVRRQLVLRA